MGGDWTRCLHSQEAESGYPFSAPFSLRLEPWPGRPCCSIPSRVFCLQLNLSDLPSPTPTGVSPSQRLAFQRSGPAYLDSISGFPSSPHCFCAASEPLAAPTRLFLTLPRCALCLTSSPARLVGTHLLTLRGKT